MHVRNARKIREREYEVIKTENPQRAHEEKNTEDEFPAELADIDLHPYLHYIVDHIEDIKRFVRENGLTEIEVQRIIGSYPNHIQEQDYQLMHSWYQKQRKKGPLFTLSNGLRKMNCNRAADTIIEHIKSDINQKRKEKETLEQIHNES
ncbi:tumor necrosis factor receptor superfamily member 6-like [Protopterus annectens]|nr:tumor necrosis factor receptor superfamily member 6-like [Protopterus annectens]